MNPAEKLTRIVERNDLFDRYLEILDRLDAWRARDLLKSYPDYSEHRTERRREMVQLLQGHLDRISEKLRAIDELINPPNYG